MPVTTEELEELCRGEQIVLCPKNRTATSTTLAVQRQKINFESNNLQIHVAGGDHTGIIVNKRIVPDDEGIPAQMSLEFTVFLVNASTQKSTLESRKLRFWFRDFYPANDQAKASQDFFKELVSPSEFPRDYVGFITKIMKLLQLGYPGITRVEIRLDQLQETEKLPERPTSADETGLNGGIVELTETKVLEMIESAYPNPLTLQDIAKQSRASEEMIMPHLDILQSKGLIKAMENNSFTRVVLNETNVRIVKQMPKIVKAKQPTIAIITAQYCEKLAVDAMIENQETFVRYTTVGESNVYTLGNMGSHRVVSTKLPSVGHTRQAMIAAGNTTTRLLGTFQKVDFVFLIGIGGGVPHFTDYSKHVRLGDVVISTQPESHNYVYLYCDKTVERTDGALEFETRGWHPTNSVLQEIAANIKITGEAEWSRYIQEGAEVLNAQEADFGRPPPESDKLYMAIGDKDVIEVSHPTHNSPQRVRMQSRVHLGPVASGRQVARDDHARQELAARHGVLAYDSEFDSVLESILGNRRDSFIVIRGISDYKDGTRRRDWQPYAALMAAAYAKAIVCRMDPPPDD